MTTSQYYTCSSSYQIFNTINRWAYSLTVV